MNKYLGSTARKIFGTIFEVDQRHEKINQIISKCNNFAQKKYKTRHDWVDKVILWKMCKKFKFDHANKWYMQNPTSVLENDTHALLWGFDIQIDHLISARRRDHILINNKKKENVKILDFAIPADYRIKMKESEKKDLAREWENMEHQGDNNTKRDSCFLYSHQSIIKGTGGLGNKRTGWDQPNYYMVENGQNIEKCPGDLRRLAVPQTPVKEHPLTLMWKTLKE